VLLAEIATDAQVGRLHLLDRVGLDPPLTELEQTVELAGRVYPLPDLFDDVVPELETTVRRTAPKLTKCVQYPPATPSAPRGTHDRHRRNTPHQTERFRYRSQPILVAIMPIAIATPIATQS
jgi:hypothetical protein